jgi:hypothetical protein
MPQFERKRQPFDLAAAQRLHDQGMSYRNIAAHLGSNYAAVYWALNATHEPVEPTLPVNGDLPAIPAAHSIAPQRTSASDRTPAHCAADAG